MTETCSAGRVRVRGGVRRARAFGCGAGRCRAEGAAGKRLASDPTGRRSIRYIGTLTPVAPGTPPEEGRPPVAGPEHRCPAPGETLGTKS